MRNLTAASFIFRVILCPCTIVGQIIEQNRLSKIMVEWQKHCCFPNSLWRSITTIHNLLKWFTPVSSSSTLTRELFACMSHVVDMQFNLGSVMQVSVCFHRQTSDDHHRVHGERLSGLFPQGWYLSFWLKVFLGSEDTCLLLSQSVCFFIVCC